MSSQGRKVIPICALLAAVAGAAFAVGRFVIWDQMLKPEAVYGDSVVRAEKLFRKKVVIEIRAVDVEEKVAVRGATVELWRGVPYRRLPEDDAPAGSLLAGGLTGPNGEATLTAEFYGVTKGDRYAEWNWLDFRGHTLVIRAEGWTTVQAPLDLHTGKRRSDRASDLITLQFKLDHPGGVPESSGTDAGGQPPAKSASASSL